jgi:hypothetical protein
MAALAMATVEVLTAFYIEEPVAAIVFAALFLGAWWWLRRATSPAPLVVLAILFAIEIAFVPTYERDTTSDWVVQLPALGVSVVGLVAVALALLRGRSRRSALTG